MRFEWDERKECQNRRKHLLGFDTAALVFDDPLHVSVVDRVVDGEERWQTMGDIDGVLVVVAHTFEVSDEDEVIRIISARKATRRERQGHERA